MSTYRYIGFWPVVQDGADMSSVQNGDEQASDGRNKITFKPLKKEHNNPNNYCLLLRGPNPPPPPFLLNKKISNIYKQKTS